MSNDTPDDAAPLSPAELIAALEAEVLDLRTREAEVAREHAAIVLERARHDEERAAHEQARGAWEAERRQLKHDKAVLENERAALDGQRGALEDQRRMLEDERDELRADRDAVRADRDEVLRRTAEAAAAREAEWAAASAGMDAERTRWVSEEADYAKQRDEDRARLQRARRFSPRHRLGVLIHRLRG
ncbi:MAG: hypothetical protein JWM31_1536 [Solirubrobacterales bacterium]|nr:hypothetical protein [Solirubrobacterales bacterium]